MVELVFDGIVYKKGVSSLYGCGDRVYRWFYVCCVLVGVCVWCYVC